MSENIILKIEDLLSVIKSEIPGLRGSFLVTTDGFIIASDTDQEIDYYETGALFSSISGQVRNFSQKIFVEPEVRASIQSQKGDIQLFPMTETTNLVIVSDSDSKPGLLLLRMKKITELLRKLINENNNKAKEKK